MVCFKARMFQGVGSCSYFVNSSKQAMRESEAEGEGELARSCYSRIFEVDIGYRDVATKMERFK